jgi:MFS family permease
LNLSENEVLISLQIGAVQSFVLLLVGVFVGPIYDRGYFKWLLVIGSFLIVFGHMMLSLCTTFWQCLLAQGFVVGIGAGCLFVPGVAIMPTYFSSKIGLAIGLAASGSSTGGIIYPIMFYKLISQVGFGWSVRILGFTVLATQLIPIAVMKMRVKPPKPRSLIDWTAFTDGPYVSTILMVSITCCSAC